MVWHRTGDKSLSEPNMFGLLTHICVTRPQCVAVQHKKAITLNLLGPEQNGWDSPDNKCIYFKRKFSDFEYIWSELQYNQFYSITFLYRYTKLITILDQCLCVYWSFFFETVICNRFCVWNHAGHLWTKNLNFENVIHPIWHQYCWLTKPFENGEYNVWWVYQHIAVAPCAKFRSNQFGFGDKPLS